MSLCVIFNPQAGRRRARQALARLRSTAGPDVQFLPTSCRGHAEELALNAAREGFRVVVAAGGDGTVHEVANGLVRSERPDVTLAVVPVGSANDFAYSVEAQFGASPFNDDPGRPVDAGVVELADGTRRYFVEGLGLGLAGRVTLESNRIRRLRGLFLYGLAAWRALRSTTVETLDLKWDDGPVVSSPTLMLSLLLGQREGNFLLAPAARIDDGWFDSVRAGRLSRWAAVRLIPRLAFRGPPRNHPEIHLGRCRRLEVRSPHPLVIHTDGEIVADGTSPHHEATISLLPSRLLAKVCRI